MTPTDFLRAPFLLVRRIYDWVLSLADRPYATPALFVLSVAEASFFPIPPDVLLIALSLSIPRLSLWFAAVTTAGSVIGAAIGYVIGYQFYELVGKPIVDFYAAGDTYLKVQALYEEWNAVAIAVAGFTPIPFKVFTIAAGAFQIQFPTFIVASILSRGARFFLIGALILWLGPGVKVFIDRYFNQLTILFVVLLVGGFLILKYVL